MKPVYDLMDTLIDAGAVSSQKFSVDPRPLEPCVPANLIQKIFFRVMYSKQDDYDRQLKRLGIMSDDAYTCTCYMDEVGNTPKEGDILQPSCMPTASWVPDATATAASWTSSVRSSAVCRTSVFSPTMEGRPTG